MTRQTWTAVASALCFVACVLAAALTPVPFVVWAPGPTTDLLADAENAPVAVTGGAPTYPTSGRLLLTTDTQTRLGSSVSLFEALHAYWAPDREVMPLWAVYAAGSTTTSVADGAKDSLAATLRDAKAAGLRSAGISVAPAAVVATVNPTGPAAGRLLPGDVVTAIKDAASPTAKAVQTAADVYNEIVIGKVGEAVTFSIRRDGQARDVSVAKTASKSNPNTPVVGVTFVQGYVYAPTIAFRLPEDADSGSGLMLSLALYDLVTPDPLLADRVVAGTGVIDANGAVSRVPAVHELVVGAERAGASVFLLPVANCADLVGAPSSVRLVPVASLAEAITALEALGDPTKANSVKGCS